jgi:hypothetical protein
MVPRRGPVANRRPLSAHWLFALLVAGAWPADAVVCTVPGTHAQIRAAIADLTCTQIQLAAQSYPESPVIQRSLSLTGPVAGGAVLQGRLRVVGAGVVVQVASLAVDNGCTSDALSASGGAQVDADRVTVVVTPGLPCLPELPFSDTFESATTRGWSWAQP